MTVFNQTTGPRDHDTYPSTTALAAETGPIQQGQIAVVQSPFGLYCAQKVVPSSGTYVTCTSAIGSQVTYYVPLTYSSYGGPPIPGASGQGAPFKARAVVQVLHAYSGSGTGTLTSTGNVSINGTSGASTDSVVCAVGDQIFIPAGITNVTAKDSGPWTIVTVGSGSVAWVLTRPVWWITGNYWATGQSISIGGEGAVFGGTAWKATAASGVIDTTDPAFYVERLTFQATLTAGTLVLPGGQPVAYGSYPLVTGTCNFPAGIFSATKSNILVSLAIKGGTITGTVSYGAANASSTVLATAGYVGTATATVFALATAMATQTTDTSTVNVTLLNF